MADTQPLYWTLAQAVMWLCTHDDKLAALGEQENGSRLNRIESLLNERGLLVSTPNVTLDTIHYALVIHGLQAEVSGLREKARADFLKKVKALSHADWADQLLSERSADFEENEAWHCLSFLAEDIKSLDGRNGIPDGLPEGTHYLYGLSTPKDDEKYWGLRETVGYIAFGQPLSIWEIREGVGHKRLEEIKATLMDALEDGRLIAEHEVREDYVTRYEEIPKECFKVKEVQFLLDYKSSESGRIRVSYNTAYTVRFRGADVLRLFQPVEAVAAQDYRNGAPGRPTSKQLVEGELHRRASAGEMADTLAKESRFLSQWLSTAHPAAPQMKAKTIENQFRKLYRQLTLQTEAA